MTDTSGKGGSSEWRPPPLLGRPLCSRQPGDGVRSRGRPGATEAAHAKRESLEQPLPAARAGTSSSRKPFPKEGSHRQGPSKGAKSLAGAVAAWTRQPARRPRVLMWAKQTLPLDGGEVSVARTGKAITEAMIVGGARGRGTALQRPASALPAAPDLLRVPKKDQVTRIATSTLPLRKYPAGRTHRK